MEITLRNDQIVVTRAGQESYCRVTTNRLSSVNADYKHKLLQLIAYTERKELDGLRVIVEDGHFSICVHYRNGYLAFYIPLTERESNYGLSNDQQLKEDIRQELLQALKAALKKLK